MPTRSLLLPLLLGALGADAQDPALAAPPQFPGSRIVTNVTGLVDPKLGKHPPPGSGQTKSLNGWANKPEAQVWALCYSSFTDNSDNATAFHKQCDMHNETMVFVKNELNFTFGGYAAGSWGMSTCCANSTTPPPGPWPYPAHGNQCFHWKSGGQSGCTDRIHEEDFIFRLSGRPQVFRPAGHCWNCGGDISEFQKMGPNQWPQWGSFDLRTGQFGPPGKDGCCLQGFTYAGYENDVCGRDGGDGSWGKTDLEVWYPVGESRYMQSAA